MIPHPFSLLLRLPFLWVPLAGWLTTPVDAQLPVGELPTHMKQMIERETTPADHRPKYDDLQKAADFWYTSRNPKLVPDMEEAIVPILRKALDQSAHITSFQDWEEAHRWKEYHDAGAVILALCYTHLYYGNVKAAREWVNFVNTKLPYSLLLPPNRDTDSVRRRMRYHEHACMLYGAIITDKIGEVTFEPERDEYDGPMLSMACRDQAKLRLKEGNFKALENYANAAREHQVRLPSGQWMIELFYDGMNPHWWEDRSENPWKEIDKAIQLWRAAMPDSITAKIAEARFHLYYGLSAYNHSDEVYSDFRARTERGLELIMAVPPECPGWYSTALGLMALNGKRFVDLADIFREGSGTYPDYQNSVAMLAIWFAKSGEKGVSTAADIVTHLATENPTQAAQVLCALCNVGCAAKTGIWLDMDLVNSSIESALKDWPDSIELRNELGLIATLLGQQASARLAMNGLGDHWCRNTWKGREAIARKLAGEPAAPKTASTQ